MNRFIEVAAVGFIVTLIGTIWLAVSSSKKISPKEDEDNGKVIRVYPHPDDPDYAQFRDNKPDWKPRKAQEN